MVGLLISSCGQSRPSAEAWQQDWNRVLAIVPAEPAAGTDPATVGCEDVLAALRTEKETLLPTPDEAVDVTLNLWLEEAEGAFFECPPENGGFEKAYDEMERLRAEIEAVLQIETG